MLASNIINRICMLAFLLRTTHAQNYPSALIFSATGLAGSVVAATGCDITYELSCTAGSTVCSDIVRTVTLNGPSALQTYQMTYTSTGSSNSTPTSEAATESCQLHGTTVAYCHAVVSLSIAALSNSLTSSFVLTDQGALGYQQVPITAGPAAALKSVSSCSASGGSAVSIPVTTTSDYGTSSTGTSSNSHSNSSSTGTTAPASGLSTAAKAGIGAGVGVGCAALLAGVGFILLRQRQKSKARKQAAANATQNFGHPQIYAQQQGPYEVAQPAAKYEMAAGQEVQELPGYQKTHELPTQR